MHSGVVEYIPVTCRTISTKNKEAFFNVVFFVYNIFLFKIGITGNRLKE